MTSHPARALLERAAHALDAGDAREVLRAAQAAQDALDAVKAEAMVALHCSGDHELDGASTVKAWARSQLRLEPHETARLLAAGGTLQQLDDVAEAARRGRLRLEHVAAFTYGVRHVGLDVVREAGGWLLDVATTAEPSAVRKVVRSLREAVYPDSLDEAWAAGMDRRDIRVDTVPDGYHLTGFLDTLTGAKLRAVLDSLGAPRSADDHRPGSERRVEALDQLLTSVLEGGLPSDKGVRPQISVVLQADGPAELHGFGPVGPRLLAQLRCGADVSGVLTDGPLPQARILNVGRAHRLATGRQRRAVQVRQGGECAGPGCRSTHLEIHHVTPWSQGGRTDLDELVGLCTRCHHLVHRGGLAVRSTGTPGVFEVSGSDPRPDRVARRHRVAARRETAAIRRLARDLRHRRALRTPPEPLMRV